MPILMRTCRRYTCPYLVFNLYTYTYIYIYIYIRIHIYMYIICTF